VAILLTRQNLDPLPAELAAKIQLDKGAYIVSEDIGFDMIIIASGSELNLALQAGAQLRKEGKKIRVVSMPSQELFSRQDKSYQEKILPSSCRKRVSIEAGSTYGWERFTGIDGLCIGLDHFGLSAPYKILADKFGFTAEKVVLKIKERFQNI
jgi:transketolase